MKLIRHKDAAGRLPEKENRKGSLRGILGLTLLLTLGVVLAAGGLGTRASAAPGDIESPGIEEDGKLVTSFPSPENTSEQEEQKKESYNLGEGQTGNGDSGFAVILNDALSGDEPTGASIGEGEGIKEENGQIYYCGKKAHTHTDACENGNNCDLEAHTHDAGCEQDLKPFFEAGKIVDGNGNEVPDGGTIVVGEEYTFTVAFQEGGPGKKQFSNTMRYQLPAGFKCDVRSGEVLNPETGEVMGTYSVDENGLLTVKWYPDRIEKYEDVKAEFTFYTVAQADSEQENVEFPWTDTNTEHFDLEHKGNAEIEKTGTYDPVKGTIQYTVEVKITEGQVEDGFITDSLIRGLKLPEDFDKSKWNVTVTDNWNNEIPGDYKFELTEDGTGWTLKNLPSPLTKDSKVVVTYEVEVKRPDDSKFNFDADNNATFTGTIPGSSENPGNWSDDTHTHIEDKMLEKWGSQVAGQNQIYWEIKVGESGAADVRGWVIKDTLGPGQEIDPSEPLEIKWKNPASNTMGTLEIPWERDSNGQINWEAMKKKGVVQTADGLEITILEEGDEFWTKGVEGGTTREWQPGDWVKVEYYTTYTPSGDGSAQTFTNKAHIDVEGTPLESENKVTVGNGAVIKGMNDDNQNVGYLEYTVSVAVPGREALLNGSGNDAIYIDGTHKPAGGKLYPSFYIEDQLEFYEVRERDNEGKEVREDRYFVNNSAEIESIMVDFEGGDTVTFVNITDAENLWDPDTNPTGQHTFKFVRPDTATDDEGMKATREFQIWFDTQVVDNNGGGYSEGGNPHPDYMNSLESSMWPFDKPGTLTIRYKVPYDAELILESPKGEGIYSETDLTLKDLLDKGEEITNEVRARRKKGDDIGKDDVDYRRPRENYSVQKDGKLSAEGVIDYQVRFNGYDGIDKDGKMIKGNIENLVFEDWFDPRLEYVEGSLKVLVYRDFDMSSTPDVSNTFYYIGTGGPVIKDESGNEMLRVPAEDFKRGGTYSETLQKFLKDHGCIYVFCYQMKLKNEALNQENVVLDNEATIYYNDKKSNDTAEVPVTNQLVKKSHEVQKGDSDGNTKYIDYTIEINPGGQLLGDKVVDEAGKEHYPDSIWVQDEMSKNMALIRPGGEIGVIVQYEGGDGNWMDLNRADSAEGVKTGSGKFFFEQTENGMVVHVPNGLHVRITYSCEVLGAEPGSTVDVSNTVTTGGAITVSAEDKTEFEVNDSKATATGGNTVYFFKQDGDTGAQLGGAKFDLYTAVDEAEAGTATVMVTDDEAREYTLYLRQSDIESDKEKGVVLEKAASAEDAVYYVLVETEAPAGYLLPDIPVVVYRIGNEPEGGPETVTVNVDDTEYKGVKVKYITTTLVVENHQMAYSLPETGGPGGLDYTAVGLTLILCGLALLNRKSRARRS